MLEVKSARKMAKKCGPISDAGKSVSVVVVVADNVAGLAAAAAVFEEE